MPKKHKLGFGNGRIVEYEDGSAAYIKGAELTHAFRVQIADVTGFSVTKSGKMLERRLNVLGNGTTLAHVDIPHGTAEKIEGWFRSHPAFGTHAAGTAVAVSGQQASASLPSPSLIADELRKLAELRAEGVLTDDEFAAQKARLLS
jgi:hypothetical protein